MERRLHEKQFAKKSLGQNFLIDQNYINKILTAFSAKPNDVVVEIGPGRGALTERLLQNAGHIYAIEFDNTLFPLLEEEFGAHKNFTLIKDDALKVDFSNLQKRSDEPLRLIANLPYNISTAILQRLFDYKALFSDCLLMFQREVVTRITAPPGSTDRGYLTVLTEAHFHVENLFDVPPNAFRPTPKVWSSIARLTPKSTEIKNEPLFRQLVSTAFAQKRKTIANNLKKTIPETTDLLLKCGIDPNRRAETLANEEWLLLAESAYP